MTDLRQTFENEGFSIIESFYTTSEIQNIQLEIEAFISQTNQSILFGKPSKDLFAIRQFIKVFPGLVPHIFNKKMLQLIAYHFGENYFMTKSIYFDKPPLSNWFVANHQDIIISVDQKQDAEGFKNWTIKQNQFGVQPPTNILEQNFTIRIHLDHTTAHNGALKVMKKSHLKGIQKVENIACYDTEICEVGQGGLLLMKPLLFHASDKTKNESRRRVIHLEFSNQLLPKNLNWNEQLLIF
ncbi:phytanoyl-CoA dioxygenase [Flavobacterium branchiophilum]|uniref:Phytanoyl-CoA dioxygenase PhyH n=1 Tax=Flavobacterium branchiophilum TaxID=55197 RepID=A0A543G791_9FLAO|nr:phytanoyl-CoA dioxygenase family protein [Flavobacterium branchiophilum]OXA74742.1 phytanoyl-CoA dioxygenase [Flavobacterium branchiophilum] [Flavobacterium branchiophilum NBRC 15030 = ATCC 35035]TQM41949.1 phytanoyl-CoA dioxygenase PhyH [Flavobacterium branchiophilum]GEM55046.1 phytanoyl-CoA dioxygenase [Flavobacterium branchiophilum NBRC 15030 = ATCC 35035]